MAAKTLKVTDNDFVLSNGRLEVLQGADAMTQILENRLKMHLGEWFLSPSLGIDWLGFFNQKFLLEKRLRVIIREALFADSRVTKVSKLDIDFNKATRIISGDFTCETTEGVVTGSI